MSEIRGAESNSPLYPAAALGFRSWRVHNGLLASNGAGQTTWRPGVNVAYCRWHLAPARNCRCGLHAHHDISTTLDYRANEPGALPSDLIGAVAARGELQVHHDGWRAAEVALLALALPEEAKHYPQAEEAAAEVAERYGVPLVPLEQLAQMAETSAEPVPRAVRPPPAKHSRAALPGKTDWNTLAMLAGLLLLFFVLGYLIAFDQSVSRPLEQLLFILAFPAGLGGTIALMVGCHPSWSSQQLRLIAGTLTALSFALCFSLTMIAHEHWRHHDQQQQIAALPHRIIAFRKQHHRWPGKELSEIKGFRTVVQVRSGLTGVGQGRCYRLLWDSGQSVQRFCLHR